jgi:predicted Zn-dependent protease
MDAMATILRDEGDDAGAKSYVALARAAHDERLRRYPEAGYGHALEHHLEFGEPERAVELAEKNRALRPNAESEICLARAYLGVARIGDAKRSIEAALATPLRMAKLHATAAAVYAAAGDVDGARSQAAKAAAINPKVALESVAE